MVDSRTNVNLDAHPSRADDRCLGNRDRDSASVDGCRCTVPDRDEPEDDGVDDTTQLGSDEFDDSTTTINTSQRQRHNRTQKHIARTRRAGYQGQIQATVTTTRLMMQDFIRVADGTRSPQTRIAVEARKYMSLLSRSRLPWLVSAEEYRAAVRTDTVDPATLVDCTAEEARQLLEAMSPRAPLLIRGSQDFAQPGLRLESFLAYLSTKKSVDVHIYDVEVDDQGDYTQPVSLPAAEAVALFQDDSGHPINLLNLRNTKPNPVPAALAGIRAYSILQETSEDNGSGKATTRQYGDLANCNAFHICGKAGVFSLPHIDHHGVITTVTCEEGKKLWLTWPPVARAAMEEWQASGDVAPGGSPFPILLADGDILIQPQGRVHAPLSLENVLMSGTMHWDSREMASVLEQSVLEAKNPGVTNEDPAKEFRARMISIVRLWEGEHKAYPWGTQEQLAKWKEHRREWEQLNRARRRQGRS
ncbi:hypothetical protein DV735_g5974, partial [Chaetothyriales sp. CBS 134920]